MQNTKKHWDLFYKKFNLKKNSSFALFVKKRISLSKNLKLLDIACGNARDTFFFNSIGLDSEGLDFCPTIIKKNRIKFPHINFFKKNICSSNFRLIKKYDILYARFFLHAITDKDEFFFFKNCKKILKKKSIFFLEFRTDKDPLLKKGRFISKNERIFGHYRRFINITDFKKKIDKFGFKIFFLQTSFSYAKYKNQKPHIARVVLKIK